MLVSEATTMRETTSNRDQTGSILRRRYGDGRVLRCCEITHSVKNPCYACLRCDGALEGLFDANAGKDGTDEMGDAPRCGGDVKASRVFPLLRLTHSC